MTRIKIIRSFHDGDGPIRRGFLPAISIEAAYSNMNPFSLAGAFAFFTAIYLYIMITVMLGFKP